MSNPLRPVARGLSLARFGLWWVVIFFILLTLEVFAIELLNLVDFLRMNRWAGQVYGWGLTVTGLFAFVGFVITFVGRCFCLATPASLSTARARIRFAVLLEVCGLVSGLTNVFAGYAAAVRVIPLPMVVVGVTGGFTLLLLVAGRVMFLRFMRSLSESVNPTLARLARYSLVALVAVVLCAAASLGLLQLANYSLAPPSLAYALSGGCGVSAASIGVAGLFLYGRLLRRLRDTLKRSKAIEALEPELIDQDTLPEFSLIAK